MDEPDVPVVNSRYQSLDTPIDDKAKDIQEEEKKEFTFSSISRRSKFLLICMALINFCACTCFSLLGPFFPEEAKKKGSTASITGFIFGVFELVIFISSPFFGNYLTRIGSKFMFLSGTITCGMCAVLFGVLDKSPDGTVYIAMCFVTRTIEALGASALITASFAIIANTFPDYVTTVLGFLETFSGLGMMCGPAIGGALYQAGGFGVPFFVMGGIVIVCGMLCIFMMPTINDKHKPFSKSILYLLRSPYVCCIGLCGISGAFSLGFNDPTLAQHLSLLSEIKDRTWAIGLMFLVVSGIYTFTAPVWGYISDKKKAVKTMVICGNLTAVLSLLLLGPSPLTPFIPFNIWTQVLALILLGLGVGCALIPLFTGLLQGAKQLGMPENFDTHGIISGFFNSCFSLGAFLGPTLGGLIVDKTDYQWGTTLCAGVIAFATLTLSLYAVVTHCCMDTPTVTEYEPIPGNDDDINPHSREAGNQKV